MEFSQSMSAAEPETRTGRSVSLDHAAQLLGVSRRTIYNRIRDGRLQTIRTLGGSQRVLIESVGRKPFGPSADHSACPSNPSSAGRRSPAPVRQSAHNSMLSLEQQNGHS